jgi:hypothetical protein
MVANAKNIGAEARAASGAVAAVPERLALLSVRALKEQARRRGLVGMAASRTLEVVHRGAGLAAGSLSKIEKASRPPAGRPSKPAAPKTA